MVYARNLGEHLLSVKFPFNSKGMGGLGGREDRIGLFPPSVYSREMFGWSLSRLRRSINALVIELLGALLVFAKFGQIYDSVAVARRNSTAGIFPLPRIFCQIYVCIYIYIYT